MTEQLKKEIIEALEIWMESHPNISQNDLASSADINAGYLLKMRKGDFTVKSGDKIVNINDKYFQRLARYIGFAISTNYWPTRKTIQLQEILTGLDTARKELETKVIIGQTGAGKTFSLDVFKSRFPTEVITVKAGSSDKLNDLIGKVLVALDVKNPKSTTSARIGQIVLRLKIIREKGNLPMLAFDEAEYMKYAALCAFKELFDLLHKECALVLVGTKELVNNIEKMARQNKPGIAQLWRRIKFKVQYLPDIDTRFEQFLEEIDPSVKMWLRKNCENYGELHDVMVPALIEADRLNQPVTLDFIKIVLGIAA